MCATYIFHATGENRIDGLGPYRISTGQAFILKLGRAQHEYFVESLEKCAEFTVNYYDVLRKCFRHYCKINHTGTNVVMGGACMSYTAWESLLTDIRVLGYDSIKKLSAKR